MVSGLLMIPMMMGVLGASILSGQVVSRTGRYKVFPVVGSVLVTVGMVLLSHLGLHTSHVTMSLYVIVLGDRHGHDHAGDGAGVQNAVPVAQMGAATAAVTFFRSLGGAFGTSLFGAVFIAGLSHWIVRLVPGAAASAIHVNGSFSMSPSELHAFPPEVQHGILESFVRSLHSMFLVGVPLAVVMFVLTLFLKEVRLRSTSGLERPAEDVAMAGGMVEAADAEFDEGVIGDASVVG